MWVVGLRVAWGEAGGRVIRRGLSDFDSRPLSGVAAACGFSAVVVCVLVGANVLLHPGRGAVGVNPSSDYQVMTWSLRWWPWAVAHWVNPLHTPLLWAPLGFSTLWMTTIPVPALVALPITLTAGPLVAFNVLMLLAVPLAGGAAYLLCHELTGRFWPSLVGSVLFAVSPYMLGHTLSEHLDLTLIFPVPLLALLVVRHLRRRTSSPRFVAGFAALLLVLLGTSFELFLDLAVLVAIGCVLGLVPGGPARARAVRTIRLIAIAYAACLPLLVPIAVLAFAEAHAPLAFAPVNFSTDLLNVVVPTPTMLAGRSRWLRGMTEHFVSNIGEQDGYLGIPLLVVAVGAVRAEWRRGAWMIGGLLVAALLLSLGPVLSFGGRPVIGLPFAVAHLPVLGSALPARWSLFVALAASCLCALWLARPGRAPLRAAVAVVVVLSLLPNFSPADRVAGAWPISSAFGWSIPRVSEGFVAGRDWTHVIKPGSTVLVLPTEDRTAASYWQAETGMRFKLAIPETPFAPPQIAASPVVSGLVSDILPSHTEPGLAAARLRAFLIADDVADVIVTPTVGTLWRNAVHAATASSPIALADTAVYPVPKSLRPLRVIGKKHTVRAARDPGGLVAARRTGSLTAWAVFDGHHARLRVRFEGQDATLSSPSSDFSQAAAAVDSRGHAVVAFVEWTNHHDLLRVATRSVGGWHVDTLARGGQPIWSTRAALLSDGEAVVVWVEERDPFRVLRAITFSSVGRPQGRSTLETATNIDSIELAAAGSQAECTWLDAVVSERRVRATAFADGRWHADVTVASTLDPISELKLAGPQATVLQWTSWLGTSRQAAFRAHRVGATWIDPDQTNPVNRS